MQGTGRRADVSAPSLSSSCVRTTNGPCAVLAVRGLSSFSSRCQWRITTRPRMMVRAASRHGRPRSLDSSGWPASWVGLAIAPEPDPYCAGAGGRSRRGRRGAVGPRREGPREGSRETDPDNSPLRRPRHAIELERQLGNGGRDPSGIRTRVIRVPGTGRLRRRPGSRSAARGPDDSRTAPEAWPLDGSCPSGVRGDGRAPAHRFGQAVVPKILPIPREKR